MRKIMRVFAVVIAAVTIFNTTAFAEPISEPSIYARSAVLYNPDEDTILYEKNMNSKIYPASMTKILTALIVLDYFEPDEIITVGAEVNEVSLDSSKAGHIKGELLSVETLIRGLIIPSGNDTSVVAACAVAKKTKNDSSLNYSQCISIFSSMMNEKAKELGCKNTNFTNPHGYHADDHYTTCYDLAMIVKESLKNELISKIAIEKSYNGSGVGDIPVSEDAIVQEYSWNSHNLLITGGEYYYQYATGLKTGFTDQAGSCVAATAEKNGTKLIAIISDSEDPNRWVDAKQLFEYGFNDFTKHQLATYGGTAVNFAIANCKKDDIGTLDLITKDSYSVYIRNEEAEKITTEITILPEYLAENKDETSSEILLKAPIEDQAAVGEIKFIKDGEVLHTAELYSSREVQKAGIIQTFFSIIKSIFSSIFTLKGLIVLAAIIVIIVVILIIRSHRNSRRYYSPYKFKNNRFR